MSSTICTPVSANSPTHPSSLFPQIARCKSIVELKQVHANLIKTGKIQDPLAAAEILRFCALSDHCDLRYARAVFRKIQQPNCFSWNTIIRALAESVDEAMQVEAWILFCEMIVDGDVEPNKFTYPSVLKACSRLAWLREGRQVHGMVVKYGLDGDEFVLSNLVRMYVLCGVMEDAYLLFEERIIRSNGLERNVTPRRQEGDTVLWNVMVDGCIRLGNLRAARKIFDEMPQRSIVSWNVMISGYAQRGLFIEAVEMFREMQIGDACPNYVTLVSVLPAVSRLGALELGKWVHLYARKNGIQIDDVLGSALIDMYSKCGSIEKALQVFEELPKRSAITWNSVIGGFGLHGRANEALDYFSRMGRSGVTPSDVAYLAVLTACGHAGYVDEGRAIFNRMSTIVGLAPRIEHYGCMVDLFGRAGLLDEAKELILNMPMEPDDAIWKALLSACKMHGNIEMGERVARRLMKIAPQDSGSYVALSNMFASRGNWEGVSEIRLLMKEMDIRKDPGCSWIELDGVVHEFLVEDDMHPKAREIHAMLEEITFKLRSAGYRPKTTQALLNVDEQEKERSLHYHSEKIAIAFGLISTSPRASLRIVKNLRICDDCHESMKMISGIYERCIVVRDRKRFHHFQSGTCSCGDFW